MGTQDEEGRPLDPTTASEAGRLAFTSIAGTLPDLSREQLQDLAIRIGTLLTPEERTDEGEVYTVIADVLRYSGIRLPPFGVIRKHAQFKRFREGAETLQAFLHRYTPGLRKVERFKALQVLTRVVVRRLHRDNVPVGVLTLSDAFKRIGAIIDDQFPGYVESGLLVTIVRGVDGCL